jgi:hypothetical protein
MNLVNSKNLKEKQELFYNEKFTNIIIGMIKDISKKLEDQLVCFDEK